MIKSTTGWWLFLPNIPTYFYRTKPSFFRCLSLNHSFSYHKAKIPSFNQVKQKNIHWTKERTRKLAPHWRGMGCLLENLAKQNFNLVGKPWTLNSMEPPFFNFLESLKLEEKRNSKNFKLIVICETAEKTKILLFCFANHYIMGLSYPFKENYYWNWKYCNWCCLFLRFQQLVIRRCFRTKPASNNLWVSEIDRVQL